MSISSNMPKLTPEAKDIEMVKSARVVFLVDDDSSVRRALTRLIKSAGYDVQAFASARDFLACRRATDERLACLVLDVRMPGLSGLDLQQRTASHEYFAAHHFHYRPR
jgi:FixJ family two-component response regulator